MLQNLRSKVESFTKLQKKMFWKFEFWLGRCARGGPLYEIFNDIALNLIARQKLFKIYANICITF